MTAVRCQTSDSSVGDCVWFLKAALNSSLVKGPAANRFQSRAMGKFLIRVPAHMAGSWLTGA